MAESQQKDVHPSTLFAALHAKFRQVYGEPFRSMGDDHLWSFRSGPSKPFIYILIDGHSGVPAVWVFDPYQSSDEVYSTTITEVSQIDDFMGLVHERIKRAARTA